MTPPALATLRDIHLPPPPLLASIFPEAWLAAGALVASAAACWYAHRLWCRRQLRAALRELARIAAAHARDRDTTRLTRGLSQLLRRYALLRFPQAATGGLTGMGWLNFLDAHGGGGAFSDGIGAALASRPYRSHGAVDEAALIALVRRWLRANP